MWQNYTENGIVLTEKLLILERCSGVVVEPGCHCSVPLSHVCWGPPKWIASCDGHFCLMPGVSVDVFDVQRSSGHVFSDGKDFYFPS